MRSLLIGILTAMLVTGIVLAAAQKTQDVERLLKAAMNTELVDGNLKAAIEQNKKVAESGNRPLAAQALVHMAECYQKLGDGEARKILERIVRDYSDQKDAVTVARARLGGTAADAGVRGDRAVWTGPKVDALGQVSPDGRFIIGRDPDGGNLLMHDIAANVDRPLTPPDPTNWSHFANDSRISRDGKQVAYVWWDDNTGGSLRLALCQRADSCNHVKCSAGA